MKRPINLRSGFTIVELIIVVVVIAILAAVVAVGYTGLTSNARDKALLSDLDSVEAEVARYATRHNGQYDAALNWDSSSGANSNINFTPTNGNTIIVTASGDAYCIRVYNPQSNSKDFASALKKGTCTLSWKGIEASFSHTCGVTTGGAMYCWGENASGKLGNGTTVASSVPSPVVATGALVGKSVNQIDVMISATCVLSVGTGPIACWGQNAYGGFGNGSSGTYTAPVLTDTSGVLAGKTITMIASGEYHTCALATDGRVYCWGSNSYGQLGNGATATSQLTPVAVNVAGVLAGKTITKIFAGGNHTCAIDSAGKLYCWGLNNSGQLGDGTTTNTSLPIAIGTSGVLAGKTITAGGAGNHTCVTDSANALYCWGINTYGAFGNGTTSSTASSTPVNVPLAGGLAGKTIKKLAVGSWSTCAIGSDDKAYCWGLGTSGQVGNGATLSVSTPTAVSTAGVLAGKTITDISVYYQHTCAVTSDAKAACWGNNASGRLGNNSTTNTSSPVLVVDP